MQFPSPLVRGRLVQRYKRFFADVILDNGEALTAHCPNPGSMLGVNAPGSVVWLSKSDSPTRKLAHTLELVEIDGAPVGINTISPNRIVAEALAQDRIPELGGYQTHRREVKFGEASRVDFLLQGEGRPDCWLEIKNCQLSRSARLAEFPDCVAARSAKHLRELSAMVAAGDRAVVLFTIQRENCDAFSACHELDPTFAQALEDAADAGVEILPYRCIMGVEGIGLSHRIPWRRQA
jgi:sugar fermentation stimulation protein A